MNQDDKSAWPKRSWGSWDEELRDLARAILGEDFWGVVGIFLAFLAVASVLGWLAS